MNDLAPAGIILEQIEIGPMQNFVYIVGSEETREVAIVDPAWAIDALVSHIEEQDLKLVAALVTHYHPDHIGGSFANQQIEGLVELQARNPVKAYAHRKELQGIRQVTGLSESDIAAVDSGDRLSIGNVDVEFLHTPGHTPGSQCFRIRDTLVSGDTLFINGCGRVDLPGSDPDEMYHSLQRLKSLPDQTLLLPGHNYGHVSRATLGETKAQNTYLRIGDLPTWQRMMGR